MIIFGIPNTVLAQEPKNNVPKWYFVISLNDLLTGISTVSLFFTKNHIVSAYEVIRSE